MDNVDSRRLQLKHASIVAAVLLFSTPVFSKSLCQESKNANELFQCTLKNHPHQNLREQTQVAADALVSQSKQFENPTLDVKSVAGNVAGENQGSTELSVKLPISSYVIGRASRVEQAQADAKKLQNEFDEEIFKIKLELIKDLYRLRQVSDELTMTEEALGTFSSVERQLRGRPARGPEQEITLNLVTLVQGDYELKKNRLTTEKAEILSRLKVIWGDGFQPSTKILPPFRQTWPDVAGELKMETHFEFKKTLADVEKAQADKNVAIAESFPKIGVGPTIERTTTGASVTYAYGINVGMDIPIFSINSGGRQVAEAGRIRAETIHQMTLRRVQAENEITVNKYKAAIESLKRSSTKESLVKNHARIDSLFRQGLAAGTVIVEAHRQILEFTLSQHEHELTAVESLTNLYQLQGKDVAEVLK